MRGVGDERQVHLDAEVQVREHVVRAAHVGLQRVARLVLSLTLI